MASVEPDRARAHRLTERDAPDWPPAIAPVGFVLSVVIVAAIDGLLLLRHVHLSELGGVAIVDLTLAVVALTLAAREAPLHGWQFGLRRTSVIAALSAALAAFVVTWLAAALYADLLGPFGASAPQRAASAVPGGAIIATVVLAPVAEELFFRGFIYGALRRWLPVSVAAPATTAMFAAAHWLSRYPVWALVPIGLLSLASCAVYERTGAVWPCIGLHAAYNAALLTGLIAF